MTRPRPPAFLSPLLIAALPVRPHIAAAMRPFNASSRAANPAGLQSPAGPPVKAGGGAPSNGERNTYGHDGYGTQAAIADGGGAAVVRFGELRRGAACGDRRGGDRDGFAQPAYALTFRDADYVCPLDGEAFSQRVAASGTAFGQMLDLKPYGYISAPWTLPMCPTSGFVIYRAKFSAEEIAKLKAYVDSYDYWAMRRSEAPYYLAAKLQEVLGEPEDKIGFTLLQATWQADGREQYERYAREALMVLERLLQAPPNEQRMITYELVSGELERRLGMFDAAQKRFERLQLMKAFGEGYFREIVELQLALVSGRDVRPHRAPPKARAATTAER
jgi:hypothetical protein